MDKDVIVSFSDYSYETFAYMGIEFECFIAHIHQWNEHISFHIHDWWLCSKYMEVQIMFKVDNILLQYNVKQSRFMARTFSKYVIADIVVFLNVIIT